MADRGGRGASDPDDDIESVTVGLAKAALSPVTEEECSIVGAVEPVIVEDERGLVDLRERIEMARRVALDMRSRDSQTVQLCFDEEEPGQPGSLNAQEVFVVVLDSAAALVTEDSKELFLGGGAQVVLDLVANPAVEKVVWDAGRTMSCLAARLGWYPTSGEMLLLNVTDLQLVDLASLVAVGCFHSRMRKLEVALGDETSGVASESQLEDMERARLSVKDGREARAPEATALGGGCAHFLPLLDRLQRDCLGLADETRSRVEAALVAVTQRRMTRALRGRRGDEGAYADATFLVDLLAALLADEDAKGAACAFYDLNLLSSYNAGNCYGSQLRKDYKLHAALVGVILTGPEASMVRDRTCHAAVFVLKHDNWFTAEMLAELRRLVAACPGLTPVQKRRVLRCTPLDEAEYSDYSDDERLY